MLRYLCSSLALLALAGCTRTVVQAPPSPSTSVASSATTIQAAPNTVDCKAAMVQLKDALGLAVKAIKAGEDALLSQMILPSTAKATAALHQMEAITKQAGSHIDAAGAPTRACLGT